MRVKSLFKKLPVWVIFTSSRNGTAHFENCKLSKLPFSCRHLMVKVLIYRWRLLLFSRLYQIGITTFSITTLSIMTLSTMTLIITTFSITTLSITTLSITTLSITTLSITTLSITTLSIMTFCITTLSIMTFSIITLNIMTEFHAECRSAECRK